MRLARYGLSPGPWVEPGGRDDDRSGRDGRPGADRSLSLPVIPAALIGCADEGVRAIDLGHALEVGSGAIGMVPARQSAIGGCEDEPLGAWVDLQDVVGVEVSEQGPMKLSRC